MKERDLNWQKKFWKKSIDIIQDKLKKEDHSSFKGFQKYFKNLTQLIYFEVLLKVKLNVIYSNLLNLDEM